jgi:hypothetical protein
MNLGIDLDNTLVDYEAAFLAAAESLRVVLSPSIRSKSQIREFLRSQPDGELTWQRLQGLAYGRCVQAHAKLYPGVKRFLWRCRLQGHSVTVVSHKTEYGHGDVEKVPLRQAASGFLAAQGLLGAQNELIQKIVFKDTQKEKIDYIAKQSFDWFIDDLAELVCELGEVSGLRVIRFDPASNQPHPGFADKESVISLSDWQQIDALINGEWTFPEIDQISRQLMNREAVAVEKYSAGGNAGVYRIELPEQSAIRLKIYPVDPDHDRLFSEFTATKVMFGLGEKYVSQPLAQDVELGVGVYAWIEGDRIMTPGQHDLESSLEFLGNLHAIRNSDRFLHVGLASAACLSGRDIEMQIKHRVRQFELPRMRHPELDGFLAATFLPTFGKLLEWARHNWPDDDGFDAPLDRALQTLSPSDFGFHNAIRRPDGSLAFLDFEYFGWDDPVKLMSDFIFHQGMSLTDEQKSSWLKGALNIYGEQFSARLNVCRPLYGLIWCLILLNDFRPEVWQRRSLADDSKREIKQEILNRQLARAQALLQEIAVSHAGLFAETRH